MSNEERQRLWREYLHYLLSWIDTHRGGENYGMSPACFEEWNENEYDELEDG